MGGTIHWATLRTHMHDLFRNQPGLDADRIDMLLSVFLMIAGEGDFKEKSDSLMSQESFVEAVVSTDICTLRNFAIFFDKDRRPSLPERVFDTHATQRRNLALRSKAFLKARSLVPACNGERQGGHISI